MIKQKNLVFLLSSSTVVTIAWIGFSIYHTAVTSTLDAQLTAQIQPIAPHFNQRTIQSILNRQDVPPTYEIAGSQTEENTTASAGAVPNVSVTVPPTPTPTTEPTTSPSPTAFEIQGDTIQ